ncbi:MAG TPA: ABC transporter substrate-binding protein [Candidatus Binatia bacterium]|jgi:ABC-type nitrate/sulfonate/bicarbonate transport system substrate-binding protein
MTSAGDRGNLKPSNPGLVTVAFFFFAFQLAVPACAQEPRKIRMAYSAFSVAFLNIFVARDSGLFKKHNLDVELIQMAGPLPIAALSAGEIDYLTGFTTGLVVASQGAPLKGLIVTMRKPPFYIVSEPSIQRPEDLAGKRFAVDRIGSLQHLVARVFLKTKGISPEKIIFTQTGSVSNTVTSLGQGAVSAALLSAPHNVIMVQKGFKQIGAADELPVNFPTSGLVVNEAKIKNDSNRIKTVIRVMLDSVSFSQRERQWMITYIKDKWRIDTKAAETVYEQWLSTLAPDGKVSLKELQDYFDIAYSFKQISTPVHVPAVINYALLDQVLTGK